MTILTVPPGTLTNCDYLVTGFKVSEFTLGSSLIVPTWVHELVPRYKPPWERMFREHQRPEPAERRRVFGNRKQPLTLTSAEQLPTALARAGFTPNRCSVKRVGSKDVDEYLAISIFWSRPGIDDSEERVEIGTLCSTFFRQMQLQYAWSAYAKEIVDHDETRILALNFSAPLSIIPSRRNHEITVDGEQLVYRPHSARTLFD